MMYLLGNDLTTRLESSCGTRQEFEACMTSLADIIKSFDIPDKLITSGSIPGPEQTLK